jgi:hypothetical protein
MRGVFSPFDIATVDLKDALAGGEQAGFVGAIRSLCNGLATLTGIYDSPLLLAMKAAAAITLLTLAGFIVFMMRRQRRS